MEALSEYGVLFLLFEQGLELTVPRLKSLSTYAFGMGTLQVTLCTAAFFGFPFFGGVQFLEFLTGAPPEVIDITRCISNYHVSLHAVVELRFLFSRPFTTSK